MDATIRRLQNNLVTLGTGAIVFGVWTVIKYLVYCLIDRPDLSEHAATVPENVMTILFIVVTMSLAVFDFILRCIIGFSARAEGHGKKKGVFYLFITVITILIYFLGVSAEVYKFITVPENLLRNATTLIIDATSFILLIEIIYSSIKLKKLLKLQGGANE